jgi:hypothetical protein
LLVLLLQLLELRQDAVRHGRPVLGVVLEAAQGEGGHLLRLLLGVLPAKPGVHDPHHLPAVRQLRPRPVHQRDRRRPVQRAPPGEQLQQHDAEAVHVALQRQVARRDVLRRGVAAGAHHARGDVALVSPGPVPRQAEIRELGPVVGVEEDVGGLEVAEDDVLPVEERHAARHVHGDAHARRPRQRLRGSPEEVVLQAAAQHVLVHQQLVAAGVGAVADELDQVGVVELAQVRDLGQPLLVPLEALLLELLDGHHPAHAGLRRGQRHLVDPALVHAPEPALAQVRVGAEALGRRAEVVHSERFQPAVVQAPRRRIMIKFPAGHRIATGRAAPCCHL